MKKINIISIILGMIAAITIGICVFIYCNKKSELEDAQRELQVANNKRVELYRTWEDINDARSY